MVSEIFIRIRIRLTTAMRAIKAFKIAANFEHQQRHERRDSPTSVEAHSQEADAYDACKAEIEREIKRIEEGRDI